MTWLAMSLFARNIDLDLMSEIREDIRSRRQMHDWLFRLCRLIVFGFIRVVLSLLF